MSPNRVFFKRFILAIEIGFLSGQATVAKQRATHDGARSGALSSGKASKGVRRMMCLIIGTAGQEYLLALKLSALRRR